MHSKLYLETTTPSYLVGWPSRDLLVAAHQAITRVWWESRRSNFDLYVSELVVQEVRAGDALLADQRLEILQGVPILPVSSEIMKPAEDLIAAGPIPRKAAGDAVHIAIATVYGLTGPLYGGLSVRAPADVELPPYRQRRTAPGNRARCRTIRI
jgi:hypothetical protein